MRAALDGALTKDSRLASFDGGAAGLTALHVACHRGSLAGVKLLLRAGASTEARTGTLKTPLVVAAEKGHAEIAALLLLFGADVHAATSRNKTAAYCACEHDHAAVLRVLLRYGAGADLDAETNYGTTPLYIAYRNRSKRVQALLGDKFERKKGGGGGGGSKRAKFGSTVGGGEFGHARLVLALPAAQAAHDLPHFTTLLLPRRAHPRRLLLLQRLSTRLLQLPQHAL